MIKKEIKIGIFAIVTIAILGWGINYLKGRDIFFRVNIDYGVFNKVDGLNDSSPIYYHGFKVGSVRDIVIDQSMGDRFIVTFALTKTINLPDNSIAQIYSLDLLGSKGIQFIKGNSSSFLQPYDTLSTSIMADITDQLSTSVLPLKEKTERLISRFDSVLGQVGQIVDKENVRNINQAIADFSASMKNIQQLTYNLSYYTEPEGNLMKTTQRLDSFLAKLNNQGQYIDTTMQALSAVAVDLRNAQLSETILALKLSLQQSDTLLHAINESKGSLGMLINDKALYHSLSESSANLNRLLIDLRSNPKRYVSFSAFDFGRKVSFDPASSNQEIQFFIQLKESKSPLKMESNEITEKYQVTEFYDGKYYRYLIAQSSSYQSILKTYESIKIIYPNSEVIAMENESVMSLKKALRKINN